MAMTPYDARMMRRALDLARQGAGQASPNPMVGAVLLVGDQIIGEGFHTYAGVKHAETIALEQAGTRARGATLVVNLEPCSHTGRTGPCAESLIQAGISRVVIGMTDPNPMVSGQGARKLEEAGIPVDVATEFEAEARRLNEPFVHFQRYGRPLVTIKAAVTLDGKIAAPEDNRGWITSEKARSHVQGLRHATDAILTGIGTVLADDCRLNDRTGQPRSRPLLRVVVDSQLRTPLESKMVKLAQGDLLIATTSAASPERRKALEARGAEVVICDGSDGRVSLRLVVAELARRNMLSLMVEAGSRVNWAFLESGVADKIYFYYAPKILGGLGSLSVAGGAGRSRRADAIRFVNTRVEMVTEQEFAVEAWVEREF
jgi:diaminohydroxyphosphoribosylaminopyrimidine deaminase / 5-amino-6-(5-phosphoribosylamino)uracil reductase